MPWIAHRLVAGSDDDGRRLDRIVRVLMPDAPLSALYRMFRAGDIRLNGERVTGDRRVCTGDAIELRLPSGAPPPVLPGDRPPAEATPAAGRAFEAMIIARTPDLIVVDKPRGMLTHGPGGVDELAAACLSGTASASLAFRPAPLHRLDRNTTGALVLSASIRGARAFSAALRDGLVRKEYLALLDGNLAGPADWRDGLSRDGERGVSAVEMPGGDGHPSSLAAKAAWTMLEPLCGDGVRTLARVRIMTGLTHQIRAQCAAHGHPLAGDAKYGGSGLSGGYILHCARLEFPRGGEAEFPPPVDAPLPPSACAALDGLFGASWCSVPAWR